MRYDGANILHRQQSRARLEALINKGAVFDLTEVKKRTLSQNNYLWTTIAYWATQTGYTKDEAESIYKWVNKDLYYILKAIAGVETTYVKHTYELSQEEMGRSIDRWINWAANNPVCPVYIPSSDDYKMVQLMAMEIERNKMYL